MGESHVTAAAAQWSRSLSIARQIKGLKLAARNPSAKGKVHAIVGIVCGSVFGLIWLVGDVLVIVGIIIGMTHP